MTKTIIWDLDGTLADGRNFDHLLDTKPKKWDEWNVNTFHHLSWPAIVSLYRSNHFEGNQNIIITARAENCRLYTENWLTKFNLHAYHCGLYMRPRRDFRPDYLVKEDIIKQLSKNGYNLVMAYDDRREVLDMYRRNGIEAIQCEHGQIHKSP